MPSNQHNSTMAKATGLIFSPFDITLAQEVPFGIPQYTQGILNGLTSVLLCVPHSSLLTAKSVDFVVGTWWLPFTMEIIHIYQFQYFTTNIWLPVMFQACRKPPTLAVLVLMIIILEALIVYKLQYDNFQWYWSKQKWKWECLDVQSLVDTDFKFK